MKELKDDFFTSDRGRYDQKAFFNNNEYANVRDFELKVFWSSTNILIKQFDADLNQL